MGRQPLAQEAHHHAHVDRSRLRGELEHRLVAAACRGTRRGKLAGLISETGAKAYPCDASSATDVARLFQEVGSSIGAPQLVIYNASGRVRGPLVGLDPAAVERALAITAFGGFLVGQQAARVMIERGSGVILFTGASASVKGYAQSAPFAMGKFALRGLAQSMARELGPQNVHVAHIVIDGAIRSAANPDPADKPDSHLDPNAIADAYLHIAGQPRSAWTHEIEVRPWTEKF
ncbi:MAG: SDR family oxidoreductase [Mesorhizobium sp.]